MSHPDCSNRHAQGMLIYMCGKWNSSGHFWSILASRAGKLGSATYVSWHKYATPKARPFRSSIPKNSFRLSLLLPFFITALSGCVSGLSPLEKDKDRLHELRADAIAIRAQIQWSNLIAILHFSVSSWRLTGRGVTCDFC